jgi:hypothetical protein
MLLLHVRGSRKLVHDQRRRRRLGLVLGISVLGLGLGPSVGSAEAAAKKAKPAKAGSKASKSSRSAADETKLNDAKVAVLAFEGDDSEPLRKHVIKVLVERGLKVNSTLKAQDNPTQYRDMGAALDLAVYVHGKIKDTTPEHAVATVTIRSAVTGRPVATATFNGFRRGLPFDVEEKLWERVGPAFKRACADAARGVRHHNAPMRIEAGTPL